MQKETIIETGLGLLMLIMLFVIGCGSGMTAPGAEGKSMVVKNEGSSSSKDYSKLLAKAQAAGSVRIIVRLDMPFVPDGLLSTQEAIDQQVRISGMQDQLCAALSKYKVKGIKRFKFTPYAAMEVDSTALRVLLSNPLVLSVEEDAPVPPTIY